MRGLLKKDWPASHDAPHLRLTAALLEAADNP
jgi:hypothetical protein